MTSLEVSITATCISNNF